MAVSMQNINTISLSEAEYVQIAHNLLAVKYYSLASFVMLFYDIIITFGHEVDQIWSRKFSKFTLLWFLNRYLSPLGFIVITASFQDPNWTNEACTRYVFFPEILRIFTSATTGTIFVILLHATYSRARFIAVSMTCLLLLELALKIWSFTSGQMLQLPPGLVGCFLVTGPNTLRFTFTWIAELIFDSIVFILTLWRTFSLNHMRGGGRRSLFNLILRNGVIYFAVILAANLFTSLTFLLAPPNLKAINASFTVSITPLMVSRLILSLRVADASRVTAAESDIHLLDMTAEITSQLLFARPTNMSASGDEDLEMTVIGKSRV